MKRFIALISALCCVCTVSAQHTVTITYTISGDRVLQHEEPFPRIMQYGSKSPLEYSYDDGYEGGGYFPAETYNLQIFLKPDGSITQDNSYYNHFFSNSEALNTTVTKHVGKLQFNDSPQDGLQRGLITYEFIRQNDKAAEIINIPEYPTQETFIFPLVDEMLSDMCDLSTVNKDSIIIQTVRALAKIYKYPFSIDLKGRYVQDGSGYVREDAKPLIFKFINDGACFPFEKLLIEDVEQLINRLADNVQADQPNSERVRLLHTIKSMARYVYNSTILKRRLGGLDKSGFDWHNAVKHEMWQNEEVIIVAGLRESFDNAISFTDNVNNHTELVDMSFAEDIVSTQLRKEYFTGWWTLSPEWWDVKHWVSLALSDYFEPKFVTAFEEYKIQGYAKADYQEEVSKLIGAAIIRTKFIDFKNSISPLEVALNNFTAKWNTVNTIYSHNSYATFPGGNDALKKFIWGNIKITGKMKRLSAKEMKVSVQFDITESGDIKNVEIINNAPTFLKNEVLRLFSLMPKWLPAQENSVTVASKITIENFFSITEEIVPTNQYF